MVEGVHVTNEYHKPHPCKTRKRSTQAFPCAFPRRTLMPMIIGEIKRYLRDNNAVRVSRSVRDLAYRALQAREYIARQEGREATVEDIVKNLSENGIDKTADEVTNALDAIAAPVSLYEK